MSETLEELRQRMARDEAQALELALLRFAGKGVDVAMQRDVVRQADGTVEVRLTFTPVRPGEQPPARCTLYHLSRMTVGRA